jgi:hypothetical protein
MPAFLKREQAFHFGRAGKQARLLGQRVGTDAQATNPYLNRLSVRCCSPEAKLAADVLPVRPEQGVDG